MKAIVYILCFLLVRLSVGFAQKDATFQKQSSNLLQKSIVPLSVMASGLLLSDSGFAKSFNTTTRDWVGNHFDVPVGDNSRYVPITQLYLVDMAGVEAEPLVRTNQEYAYVDGVDRCADKESKK